MNFLGCVKDAVSGNFMLSEATLDKEDASQLLHEAGINVPGLNKANLGKDIFEKILPEVVANKGFDATNFKTGKGDILRAVDKELGRESAVELLRQVFLLGATFLSRTGFTLSAEDLDVPESVKKKTAKIIEGAEEKAAKIIESYYDNTLE